MLPKNLRAHVRGIRVASLLIVLSFFATARLVAAQTPTPPPTVSERQTANQSRETDDLSDLLRIATSVNPKIRAARNRVDVARARVGPAAAWPDPMLMAGIQNLPLGSMERDAS